MDQAATSPTHRSLRLHLVMALTTVGFAVLVGPFTVPVFLGAILAAAAFPLFTWFMARTGLGRSVAAAITTALVTLGVLLPITLLVVGGVRSAIRGVEELQARFRAAEDITRYVQDIPWMVRLMRFVDRLSPVDQQTLRDQVVSLLQQAGPKVGQAAGGVLQDLPETIIFLFILLVALYYLLVDWTRLRDWFVRQSPFHPTRSQRVLTELRKTCVATLMGSLAVATVQSLIMCVALLVAGVPGALVWVFVQFVASLLPLVGVIPVTAGAAIYLVANSKLAMAALVVGAGCVAGIADNIVRALVIGGGSRQHPLVAIISIFGGLYLMGFPGLFIGPVLASLFFAVLELYTEDITPAPEPRASPLIVPPSTPPPGTLG
ncbi:MAG: AI-2E family transporter [Myxococcota bacterium]